MELRGRLPGATLLATPTPSSTGRKLKSVSSLFSRKPWTMMRLPKKASIVVVIETALPSPSTIEICVVPGISSTGIVVVGDLHAGRVPASALPMDFPGWMSIERSRRYAGSSRPFDRARRRSGRRRRTCCGRRRRGARPRRSRAPPARSSGASPPCRSARARPGSAAPRCRPRTTAACRRAGRRGTCRRALRRREPGTPRGRAVESVPALRCACTAATMSRAMSPV